MRTPRFLYFDLDNVLLKFDHHLAARQMAEVAGLTEDRVWDLVFGSDLEQIARVGQDLEAILRKVPGTRSVYAKRELGGLYLDVTPDRDAIARYGLSMADVLSVVETAIGGMVVDRTIEGRERYTISVRYPSELRDNPDAFSRVLVPVSPPGAMSPQASMGAPDGMGGADMQSGPTAPARPSSESMATVR